VTAQLTIENKDTHKKLIMNARCLENSIRLTSLISNILQAIVLKKVVNSRYKIYAFDS